MKGLKKTFIVLGVYGGIIFSFCVIYALLTKEYIGLLKLGAIFGPLLVLYIFLYNYLLVGDREFYLTENEVVFMFEDHSREAQIREIDKVIVTTNRYLFIVNNEKIPVLRIKGFFKWERDITEDIRKLKQCCGIKIEYR